MSSKGLSYLGCLAISHEREDSNDLAETADLGEHETVLDDRR